jgi:hypothetical protein
MPPTMAMPLAERSHAGTLSFNLDMTTRMQPASIAVDLLDTVTRDNLKLTCLRQTAHCSLQNGLAST